MKKALILSLGMMCFGLSYGQLSSDVSKEDFSSILQDKDIQMNWNEVQSFTNKETQKNEDLNAVYNGYLNALRTSSLNDNPELNGIIQKEIEAVEEMLNRK